MLDKPLCASLTRISDLNRSSFEVTPLEHSTWGTGDYVVCEVLSRSNTGALIELTSGRMTEVMAGDHLIGALGIRAATLEAAGHWNAVGPDLTLHALTAAGLMGKATSVSPFISSLLDLQYCGHVTRNSIPVRMKDFVNSSNGLPYDRPTILLIGTSMSSGKTTSAKVIIRELAKRGLNVCGSKLTGAGRLKDTLAMRDAGADTIFDFVDVGMPSTVCPAAEYRSAITGLLGMIQAAGPDVVIAEAGASPLEPYNGEALMEQLHPHVRCTVLCASDPYSVLGVTTGFGFAPDFVAGVATSTSAGVDVIRRLTGSEALNLLDPSTHAELSRLLVDRLQL